MRDATIIHSRRNGRLSAIGVKVDHRYEVDPPQKPFLRRSEEESSYNQEPFSRYLEGHSRTKHGREIDGRRQNLYDAERQVKADLEQKSFESLEKTAEFLAEIMRTAWWQRRYRCRRLKIKPGYGARRGYQKGGSVILLPKRARNKWYALHELTHVTVPKPHSWHGRLYVSRLMEIVGWHFGSEVLSAFREACTDHNVRRQRRPPAARSDA
jgi:hypothetical protein